jgi:RNA polymerase sigma-70 factor (ECF subfamily)
MPLQLFRRKVATGTAAEARGSDEFLQPGQDVLTLEDKVTRYFEKLRDPVHRYLVAVFGQPAEAEEITQEAFLQLYRTLREGQTINNMRAWLFRVAHNLAVNRVKSQQFVQLLDDESWDEMRLSLSDARPNPEQRLLEQEKFDRLRAQIARLTLLERQCLHLRTKGFRYREIAEVTGLSTTTVAETLYRVIGKLTKENNG